MTGILRQSGSLDTQDSSKADIATLLLAVQQPCQTFPRLLVWDGSTQPSILASALGLRLALGSPRLHLPPFSFSLTQTVPLKKNLCMFNPTLSSASRKTWANTNSNFCVYLSWHFTFPTCPICFFFFKPGFCCSRILTPPFLWQRDKHLIHLI